MITANESTRERIIESALALFALQGLEGTSVRDISQKAGVNIAAISYYFTNKLGLYHAVLKKSFDDFNADITTTGKKGAMPMSALCEELFDVVLKNKNTILNLYKFIMSDEAGRGEPLDMRILGNTPGREVLTKTLVLELDREPRPEEFHWVSHTLFSNLFGTAVFISSPWGQRPQIKSLLNKGSGLISIQKLMEAVLCSLKKQSL
jgi:AcrR family transcriptional regulator